MKKRKNFFKIIFKSSRNKMRVGKNPNLIVFSLIINWHSSPNAWLNERWTFKRICVIFIISETSIYLLFVLNSKFQVRTNFFLSDFFSFRCCFCLFSVFCLLVGCRIFRGQNESGWEWEQNKTSIQHSELSSIVKCEGAYN